MEMLTSKTSHASDEEIIRKIIAGDTAFFEILIRRYNPLLYKIARTYGLNHHDAEDMMQEAHFTAYTRLASFRFDASYKTWLTKILLHKCYHKLHYGSLKYENPSNELPGDNISPMNALPGKHETEKTVINKELAAVLEYSLQQLPLPYRSVFVLRELEGFSVAETAEMLAITETNVKVRSNRAKTMLQKQLEQFYSAADIFDFHLKYCDPIVEKIFKRIEAIKG